MYSSTISKSLTDQSKLHNISAELLQKTYKSKKTCERRIRETAMKKLSKMIIIALGVVLLASGVASAKIQIEVPGPNTSTSAR
jgi:phage terminase large subunit GpA-like protein